MKKKLFIFISLIIGGLFITSCSNSSNHQHIFQENIIAATCEDEGYTSHICHECGYEYRDTFVDATNHNFETYISESLNLESNIGDEIYQCTKCDKVSSTSVSSVNTIEKGVKEFSLGYDGKYIVSCEDGYATTDFFLSISNLDSTFNGSIYYTFKADEGLFYRQSFRLDFYSDGSAYTYAYENGNYPIFVNNYTWYIYDEETNEACFSFFYKNYGLTEQEAIGNFAFYIVINNGYETYEYENKNPYVLEGYSETWIKVNKNNRFYYTTKYQTHVCENWSRPDITKADINWTHICRAETPEEAIVSTLIAEDKGATNVDFNLLTLKPIFRNFDDMSRIFHSFKDIGTIAVYYDSSVSQQERLNLLKLAVEAGCGGVDLQGFMFHEGSTLDTHTDENVQYWEERGFDMSFINASPKETTIDPIEDTKHIEYIDMIHELGGKVLGSAHVSTQFTRRQAVAFGEFMNHRGLDIIKVVSFAHNLPALEGTILANRDAYYSQKITAKYSIHFNSSSQADISRIIGPLYYHCFMAFHYTNLCKLQMMMDFLNSDVIFDDTITISEAINRIKNITKDPEYNYLVNEYSKLSSNVGYALGLSSDMSERWTFSGNDTSLKLRSADGTNSFAIRGGAYNADNYSNNFEYETSLSGYFKPFTSSSRLPKFGIFIGDQDHMLALTYNFRTSNGVGTNCSVGLFTNSYYFGYDKKIKDALDTSIIDEISVDSNVVNGDTLRLKVKYEDGNLSLYYSVSTNGDMNLIKTFTYDEIKNYFTHDSDKKVYFGNVVETYLGSSSVGVENIINFGNVVIKN